MITLYVKIHKITGLKYFGKTTKNPFTYTGSGKYWKRHLKVHGNNVSTVIVGEYLEVSDLLKTHALNFSTIFDIVRSKNWANLINENGTDGNCPGTVFSEETRNKLSAASTGRKSPKKGKTYVEYFGASQSESIISKMKASKYHSASSYEERFGSEKAIAMRTAVTKQLSGSNNPNAAEWLLTSPLGVTEVVLELKTRLNELNLPYGTLKDSVFYNRPVQRGKAKGWQLTRTDNEN